MDIHLCRPFQLLRLEEIVFVDFTGCGEHEDHYGYITILPDAVLAVGGGQGCRLDTIWGRQSLLQKFLMRKTGSFNRIMSGLCCRTVPGYGSVRIGTLFLER